MRLYSEEDFDARPEFTDPEVLRTMKQVMIQRLLKEEFDNRVKPEDVSEEEMKKFYEVHSSDYNKPEEVRVSAIVKPASRASWMILSRAAVSAP